MYFEDLANRNGVYFIAFLYPVSARVGVTCQSASVNVIAQKASETGCEVAAPTTVEAHAH